MVPRWAKEPTNGSRFRDRTMTTLIQTDTLTVKFTPNDAGNLRGSSRRRNCSSPVDRLRGCGHWLRHLGAQGRAERHVPGAAAFVNGERRSYALLRPTVDPTAQNAVRDLILQAYDDFASSLHSLRRPARCRRPLHPCCLIGLQCPASPGVRSWLSARAVRVSLGLSTTRVVAMGCDSQPVLSDLTALRFARPASAGSGRDVASARTTEAHRATARDSHAVVVEGGHTPAAQTIVEPRRASSARRRSVGRRCALVPAPGVPPDHGRRRSSAFHSGSVVHVLVCACRCAGCGAPRARYQGLDTR